MATQPPEPAGGSGRAELYKGLGTAFATAVELVAFVLLGYFLGRYLDGKFHVKPWLSVAFMMLGAVGGFIRLYYQAKMQEDEGVPTRGSGRPEGGPPR